jgi:hypothetical protein
MGLERKTTEQNSHDGGKREDDIAALDADALPNMSCSTVET